ncbi:hypothetical protein PATA110616_14920 [Paenibacillus tarimensis]
MVNLVGYETYTATGNWSNPQYAIVHDNWETTGTDVYQLLDQYGSITDMWKLGINVYQENAWTTFYPSVFVVPFNVQLY